MGLPRLSFLICKMGIITRLWVPLDSHNMEGAGPREMQPWAGVGWESPAGVWTRVSRSPPSHLPGTPE